MNSEQNTNEDQSGRSVLNESSGEILAFIRNETLGEILAFIRGEGKMSHFGKGIHTHPGYDANQEAIHLACIELEEKGYIYRHREEPGHVFWMPNAELSRDRREPVLDDWLDFDSKEW